MRNAVIRKKRLKAERIVDDYMRMPQRLIVPTFNFSGEAWVTPEEIRAMSIRLWSI